MTVDQIIKMTEQMYHLSPGSIRGHSRRKTTSEARAVAAYLIRRFTNLSLWEITDALNKRSHCSIKYGIKRVAAALEQREITQEDI